MEDLVAAIEEIEKWSSDRKSDRDSVVTYLNNTADDLNAAIAVWKDVIESPNTTSEGEMATMNMVGKERSRKLHEIGLDTIANKRAIFKLVGGEIEFYSGIQDSLVEDAYLQLKSGETLADRAGNAIDIMQDRISKIQDLSKRAAA
jgi:hypothetical protein